MVDAREVSLLIADFSGGTVVRLTSTDRVEGARSGGAEQAETLALPGIVYDRVLRTQQADVQPADDGARMVVRVTDRGTPSVCWNWWCPASRRPRRSPTSAVPRTRWPTSSSPPAGTPTRSSGACVPAPFSLAAVPGRERTARPVRHRPGRW
jgi:hypothetical protein